MNTIHRMARPYGRRNLGRKLLGMLAMCSLTATTFAQDNYPTRPIELIVPYTAGGTSDLIGRVVAKALSERLKTPVIVLNRAGAAGTLGMRQVAGAAPDGYTIGVGGTTNLAIAPYLATQAPYDPIKDFTPLAVAATAPFILVTSPQANFRSVDELIARAKGQPGKLNYGSSGIGSSHHVMTELFARTAGFTAVHIPFKGGAENVTQLMAGTVDFMFESSSSILPQITGGRVRALAVSGKERLPELPNTPTVQEAGVKDFVVESVIGIVAPAQLPPAVHAKLSGALFDALSDPTVRESIARTGSGVPPVGKSEFQDRLKADAERWRKVIRDAGISSN